MTEEAKSMGTSGVEVEVQRLRMEAQFLQWEKDLLAKKLEAAMKGSSKGYMPSEDEHVRHQVDSDVDFRLRDETSGYVSP